MLDEVTAVKREMLRLGPDTYLVRALERRMHGDAWVNSLVIGGREPLLVDTGSAAGRLAWIADVFGVVDPADVRWIFLSHDDPDHVGNLADALEACPRATVVTSAATVARLLRTVDVPSRRVRIIEDGDAFEVGDRKLVAVRPPLYDSPATLGLYDVRSGVYWAADSFGIAADPPVDDASELPADAFADGMRDWARMLSPWVALLDPARFAVMIERIDRLGAAVVAGAHGPPIRGARLRDAYRILRELPAVSPPPEPSIC